MQTKYTDIQGIQKVFLKKWGMSQKCFGSGFRMRCLVLCVMLCGCSDGKDMSLADGEVWYEKNKEPLMKLHAIVLQDPSIERVEPAMRIQFIPKSRKFSKKTMVTYRLLEQQCIFLGIKHLRVAREKNIPTGELVAVTYTLSSSGLAVSGGRALSIEYIPDDVLVSILHDNPEYILEPLDEENWYIVDYREGRISAK